jgi:hypothetical protein
VTARRAGGRDLLPDPDPAAELEALVAAQAAVRICSASLRGSPTSRGKGGPLSWAEWFAIACARVAHARASGADRLEASILAGLQDRYDRILARGRAANPPPPRPPGPASPAQAIAGGVPVGPAGRPPWRGLEVPGGPAGPTDQQSGRARHPHGLAAAEDLGVLADPGRRAGVPDRALLYLDRAQAGRQSSGRLAPTVRGRSMDASSSTLLNSYRRRCSR